MGTIFSIEKKREQYKFDDIVWEIADLQSVNMETVKVSSEGAFGEKTYFSQSARTAICCQDETFDVTGQFCKTSNDLLLSWMKTMKTMKIIEYYEPIPMSIHYGEAMHQLNDIRLIALIYLVPVTVRKLSWLKKFSSGFDAKVGEEILGVVVSENITFLRACGQQSIMFPINAIKIFSPSEKDMQKI